MEISPSLAKRHDTGKGNPVNLMVVYIRGFINRVSNGCLRGRTSFNGSINNGTLIGCYILEKWNPVNITDGLIDAGAKSILFRG
jgi:hypothetical protein